MLNEDTQVVDGGLSGIMQTARTLWALQRERKMKDREMEMKRNKNPEISTCCTIWQ